MLKKLFTGPILIFIVLTAPFLLKTIKNTLNDIVGGFFYFLPTEYLVAKAPCLSMETFFLKLEMETWKMNASLRSIEVHALRLRNTFSFRQLLLKRGNGGYDKCPNFSSEVPPWIWRPPTTKFYASEARF